MKNPAFGVHVSDDESTVNLDLADSDMNVERDALRNLSRITRSTPESPFARKDFVVRTLADRSTVIIICDDIAETSWKSPPPPCRKGDILEFLCDGHMPTCEPYQGISENMVRAGYAPIGCKAYRKCSLSWEKKVAVRKIMSRGR